MNRKEGGLNKEKKRNMRSRNTASTVSRKWRGGCNRERKSASIGKELFGLISNFPCQLIGVLDCQPDPKCSK